MSDDKAVSEIVGEMLMLAVTVIAFSAIAMFVFSFQGADESPNVDITTWVDVPSSTMYFRNMGGDVVDVDELRLVLNLNGSIVELSSADIISIYGGYVWNTGDVISINSSDNWGIDIEKEDLISANLVHTPSSSLLISGPILGDEVASGSFLVPPGPSGCMISCWTLNENSGSVAYDSVGGNDGTVHDATWTPGINGSALLFNGDDDRVEVDDDSTLNPREAISVEAWVKWSIDPAGGDNWANIVNKGGEYQYQLQHGPGNTAFEFALQTMDDRKWVYSTTSPVQDRWYHVVGTYSTFDSQMCIYVDGVLEDTQTLTGEVLTTGDPLMIGKHNDQDRNFEGVIDEVCVYGCKLTDFQVRERYERFRGPSAPVLSAQSPATPHSSSITQAVTFSATSDQDSYNEFLLDGVRQGWSNGTSPSFELSGVAAGSYTVTLIARNSTDMSLTDTMTWVWNVTTGYNNYAEWLVLNKPDKGGILRDGGYLSFTNDGNYRYVEIDGIRYDLQIGDEVKLEVLGDQTSGEINMNGPSSQISTFDLDVKFYVDGVLQDSGPVTSIYVSPFSDLVSTLSYELAPYDSQVYLEVNGSTVIPWWPVNSTGVNVYEIGVYDTGVTNLNFDPSGTYLVSSGYYELVDGSVVTGGNACWPLDENSGTIAYDSMGVNDGTVNGASWTTGVNGSALSFDGVNDYMQIDDPVIDGYPFTVCAWIRTNASGDDMVIASLADSSRSNSYYGIFIDHPRGIGIRARNTATREVFGSTDVADGQWHYVVGVFASDSERRLYVDGVLEATDTSASTYNSDADAWSTGRWPTSLPDAYFEGDIDEVCVNGTAWSDAQVVAQYASYMSQSTVNDAWWRFEGTGDALDSIGDNDGVFVEDATRGSGVNGSALVVGGRDDYVSVPDGADLDLLEEGTIEAWINMDSYLSYSGIVHKGEENDWSDEAYTLQFYNTRKVLLGILNEDGDDVTLESTTYLADDTWYHLVGTWDASSLKIYVNGALENTAPNTVGSARNSDGSLQLGAQLTEDYSGYDKFGFNGIVDEVRLYHRALDAGEVQQQYLLNAPAAPSTTVSYRVSGSRDDAEERINNGKMDRSSSDLELIKDSNDQEVGIRFRNVDIPQGSTIESATVTFVIDEYADDETDLEVYAHDIDDSPEFETDKRDITDRDKTTASVQWNDLPSLTVGEELESVDISPVIQEIVNRPGWSAGNSLSVIITGSGKRTVESYDGSSSDAALISITYSS